MTDKTLGQKLHPLLYEIEMIILESMAYRVGRLHYPDKSIQAAATILMDVILDKMWEVQENDQMSQEDRNKMAEACGKEIRALIWKYTNIDTHKLIKQKE